MLLRQTNWHTDKVTPNTTLYAATYEWKNSSCFIFSVKAGPLRLKQLANTLKIRILSETSILYLIRYASIILIVGPRLSRRMQTSEHCWKKNSGIERPRTSIVQQSLDHRADTKYWILLWPWPWVYDLGSRSWHTLGSWTTIVWNIMLLGKVVMQLFPGHEVYRRTDKRQTDRQTDGKGDCYTPHKKTLFAGGITTVDSYHILNMLNTYISILLRERVHRFSVEVKRTELICVIWRHS